jgi:hypothetical protein
MQAQMALWEPRATQVMLEHKAQLEQMVLRGNKEFKVFKANTGMLAHKDLKERRAKKAIPGQRDHKANKDLLGKLFK